MEDFAVTCPLVLGVPHLRSGSCTSPRAFGLGFLQTPSHDDALALLLAFGSSYTWLEDFHLDSSVPCPAHTFTMRGGPLAARPSRLCGWASLGTWRELAGHAPGMKITERRETLATHADELTADTRNKHGVSLADAATVTARRVESSNLRQLGRGSYCDLTHVTPNVPSNRRAQSNLC